MPGWAADWTREGGVDEVAGDHALALGADRHRRFAREHSCANVEVGTEALDGGDELERRADAPFGVVLLGNGRSPQRHHGVADELLHSAAVALDHAPCCVEVVREDFADLLGIAALRVRREPDEVGEEDRDEPSLGDRGRCPRGRGWCFGYRAGHRRSALRAELRGGRDRGAGPGRFEPGPFRTRCRSSRRARWRSGRRDKSGRRPRLNYRAFRPCERIGALSRHVRSRDSDMAA